MASGKHRSGEHPVIECTPEGGCPVALEVRDGKASVRVIGWFLGVGLPVVGGIAGWGFNIAWGHEGKLNVIATQAAEAKEQAQRSEGRIDKRFDELRDEIRRLGDRFDARRP